MKIGVTYLYTIMRYGYPPKPEDDFRAFDEIREMGFRYLEMEGLGKEHGASVKNNIASYRKALSDSGIHVHNFCIVDPDLVSLDDAKRHAAYENFKAMAEIGASLEAETLHIASYAPPVRYVGKKPYQLDSDYSFGSDSAMIIPEGFSWQRVWDVLVESCRTCAEAAQKLGKILLMEPRIGETICSADSLIRLIDDAGMENLKANFDTGHLSAQRENVCLALMKLEGRFANIHIADNDPVNADHITVGTGTIDWPEFFRILKEMRYAGYLGLDLGREGDISANLCASRDYVRKVADQVGCSVTW